MKNFFKEVVRSEKIYIEKVAETIQNKRERTEILLGLLFVGCALIQAKAYPKYFEAYMESALKQPEEGKKPVEA